MRSLLLAGLFVSANLMAQDAGDFIPLQVGNQWVYQLEGRPAQEPVVASLGKQSEFGGEQYYRYEALGGSQWIRLADGVMYAFDTQTNSQRAVITADGEFTPLQPDCGQTGRVVSRSADYRGPLGTLYGVIEVEYSGGHCADAGIEREMYLPYIGLIQRTELSIAGPRTYNLVYARIGGVTVVSAPETSFTLALDSSLYDIGATARARLAIRHAGQPPLILQFPSGQEFDIFVRNARGETVWVWSANKLFTQEVHSIEVEGEKNWTALIPLEGLPPGTYTAEAVLTIVPERSYTATVAFMITGPEPATP